MIRVSPGDSITKVKVVTGDGLAPLDTTGTLTQKYQARCLIREHQTELVVGHDTELLRPFVQPDVDLGATTGPLDHPHHGELLSIDSIFRRLTPLVGMTFGDSGYDQERNRGAVLHKLVCETLGYADHHDDGRFPDVRHQILEVKLQTSPTIDLGLVRPDSTEPLDVPQIQNRQIRHCDVRYAVFCGRTDGTHVKLTHLFVTTGEALFRRFPQFQGKVLNKKLQIPLPANFFD